jgi:tyrosyl-tRNA synthetase
LTPAAIQANATTYKDPVLQILDAALTGVAFNACWFGEMPTCKLIEIAARHTVARMLERAVTPDWRPRVSVPLGAGL